MLLVGVIHA